MYITNEKKRQWKNNQNRRGDGRKMERKTNHIVRELYITYTQKFFGNVDKSTCSTEKADNIH